MSIAGCGGDTLNLPDAELDTVTYRDMSKNVSNVLINFMQDDYNDLRKIKFCSTGATTVIHYIDITFKDDKKGQFGIVNFGAKDDPFYRVSHRFSGDKGEDLRWPCRKSDNVKFTEIVEAMFPGGLEY